VALSPFDRSLLQRCLSHADGAWEDFVNRFLGLVLHVIVHTAQARSIRLTTQDTEDLAAEVFLAIVEDDYRLLRRFRGASSLATYLTVVARRLVVRDLLKRKAPARLSESVEAAEAMDRDGRPEERIANRDEVEQLLSGLHGTEADVVRLFYLEGKTYQEISSQVGMPENSVGPTLSRARAKMSRSADTTQI
jgi:RNA polymerase sigma-70 factor (ECF subfamily)